MRGGIPKYAAIARILQERLERDLSPGSRIPSETELCGDFEVSRATIQQAMRALEISGCIRREQGRGTFYVGSVEPRMEQRPSELLETVIRGRDQAETKLVHKSISTPPPRVAARLQLQPAGQIVYLERVGWVDGEPIVFIRTYLPHALGVKILNDEKDLARMSVARLLEDKHDTHIASVHQLISASLADPCFAHHLGCKVGDPVLEGQRTYFDESVAPMFYTTSFYRADRHCFVVSLREWR